MLIYLIMLTDAQIDFVEVIVNFYLSMFSLYITILTVLLSFVLSKKEELVMLNDIVKNQGMNHIILGKIQVARRYILKMKKKMVFLIIGIVCSFSLYLYGNLCVYLNECISYNLLLVISCIFLLFSIVFFCGIIKFYISFSKI